MKTDREVLSPAGDLQAGSLELQESTACRQLRLPPPEPPEKTLLFEATSLAVVCSHPWKIKVGIIRGREKKSGPFS